MSNNDWPFQLPEARRDWRDTGDGIELLEVLPDRAEAGFVIDVVLHRLVGERLYGDGGDGLFVFARRVGSSK